MRLQRSAIGTVVERSSSCVTLIHPHREDGYRVIRGLNTAQL
jgi:hypothetical protein